MRNSLSEIFIQALNENYSDKSVGVALIKCDQILKKELEIVHSEEEFVEYFFDSDGEELKINNKGTELFAFWDVFREQCHLVNFSEFNLYHLYIPRSTILTGDQPISFVQGYT